MCGRRWEAGRRMVEWRKECIEVRVSWSGSNGVECVRVRVCVGGAVVMVVGGGGS